MLLAAPGYRGLLSRFVAHSKDDKCAKSKVVSLVWTSSLGSHPYESLNFSYWRVTSSSDLSVPGYNVESISRLNEVSSGNHSLFSHEGALRASPKFLGFVPGSKLSNTSDSCQAAGLILTIARLDAFVAITIICLRDNGTDNVDGHRQKLCQDQFSYFSLAYNPLIKSITLYVKKWCAAELTTSEI